MPILTLQQRSRELGRIRIGELVAGPGGKMRPAKRDKFRLTSPSQALLVQVAQLYGGDVRPWTPANGGPAQWEVGTEADRLPVLVPPEPVSQWFELWSGGGCLRRCDGQRDVLSDSPCVCDPDPERRDCKPTTRLNVVLRDVPGLGVWRLESHGYYAAVELPTVAGFLAATRGYVRADLILVERVVKRQGDAPKRFLVPALEVSDVTPAQLLAGEVPGSPAALAGEARPAIGPAAVPIADPQDDHQLWIDSAQGCATLEQLSGVLRHAQAAGYARNMGDVWDPVVQAFLDARKRLSGPTQPAADEPPIDPDQLWMQILAGAPDGWDTAKVEQDFLATTGKQPADATPRDMAMYLAHTRGRR